MANQINVNVTGDSLTAQPGSVGLETQVPGQGATVSAAANATGGIGDGNFIEADVDDQLFKFKSATPLFDATMKAKRITVDSPVVEHYMIDEPRAFLTVKTALSGVSALQTVLKVESKDQNVARPYSTLSVIGVDGYAPDGTTKTPGSDLMLYVVGFDTSTGDPIVRAVNGKKNNPSDEYSTVPDIPVGTKCLVMANAMYETQKEVDPNLVLPKGEKIYLQKRGFNAVVSDYFDSQRKRIPFTRAVIAEQTITTFKTESNRTFWRSQPGHMKVKTDKMGLQDVYFTKGIRWQFKRELRHSGKWTIEDFIALAKMYYTGRGDKPSAGTMFCGKNLLETVQCIDYSKHPEVQISMKENTIGWKCTTVETVFGDIYLKHDPGLDDMGCSNSGALMSLDHLVHYVYKSEQSFDEQVEGHEARRNGAVVWDGVALKGTCHIWIDGEETSGVRADVANIVFWNSATAPTGGALVSGRIYYLEIACPGIDANALSGQMWKWDGSAWQEFTGEFFGQ